MNLIYLGQAAHFWKVGKRKWESLAVSIKYCYEKIQEPKRASLELLAPFKRLELGKLFNVKKKKKKKSTLTN